ncbi:hypothetical protein [Geodermatophilus nigrescens]|uniref:Uncharacterized protein n=1 Tax=Geodermatophilus nigrescens TaxID=1070870 RepID=A0A1M5RYE0_9ACTN|nr:hypothetical protein [Geodermatophilus nigrescens]SHH30813.1 hypothetical protein SAMN05444351_4528 [Geodermatophilus nigrescens]
MTHPASPWSDPATETEPVAYAGPPVSAPPPQPYPGGWAPPGYGWPPQQWPAYGPPAPARPRRPGQVVAAAVLSFVQAAAVALSSAYLLLLASTFGFLATEFGGDAQADALVTEATVVTVVQLLSAVALVVGGVLVLNRRGRGTWATLVAALGVQLALSLYWVVRLSTLDGFSDDVVGPAAVLVVGVLFFTAAPAVALGLLLVGPVRRWAAGTDEAVRR